MTVFPKHPAGRMAYLIDWPKARIAADQPTRWTVAPDHPGGLTVAEQADEGRRSVATFAGGVAGTLYRVSARCGGLERRVAILAEGR